MPSLSCRHRATASTPSMGVFCGKLTRVTVTTNITVFAPSGYLVGLCDDVIVV